MSDTRIPSNPLQLVHSHIDKVLVWHWKVYVVTVWWGEQRFGPWYTLKPVKALDIAHDQCEYVRHLKTETIRGL